MIFENLLLNYSINETYLHIWHSDHPRSWSRTDRMHVHQSLDDNRTDHRTEIQTWHWGHHNIRRQKKTSYRVALIAERSNLITSALLTSLTARNFPVINFALITTSSNDIRQAWTLSGESIAMLDWWVWAENVAVAHLSGIGSYLSVTKYLKSITTHFDNPVSTHRHKIHPYRTGSDHHQSHTGTASILQFLDYNFQVYSSQYFHYSRKTDTFLQTPQDFHSSYRHIFRTCIHHNQADSSKWHHSFQKSERTRQQTNVPKPQYLDSGMDDIQSHFPAADHRNILQCNDHSWIQWWNRYIANILQYASRRRPYDRCNCTVDSRGNCVSRIQVDICCTHDRRCLDDIHIVLWVDDIHCSLIQRCRNRTTDIHWVRIRMFLAHMCRTDVQQRSICTCNIHHFSRTGCCSIQLDCTHKLKLEWSWLVELIW